MVLAHEQVVPVLPALSRLVSDQHVGGGLVRGSVVRIEGVAAASVALALVAGPSAAGSWVAVVGCRDLGLAAAAEAGVVLERLALVAEPSPDEWAGVVAAFVGAVDVVVMGPTHRVRAGDARRLAARARERGTILIQLASNGSRVGVGSRARSGAGAGAIEADLRLTGVEARWQGLGHGHGHLQARRLVVEAGGRRRGARPRRVELWLPDARGAITTVAPSPTMAAATTDGSRGSRAAAWPAGRWVGPRAGRRLAGGELRCPNPSARWWCVAWTGRWWRPDPMAAIRWRWCGPTGWWRPRPGPEPRGWRPGSVGAKPRVVARAWWWWTTTATATCGPSPRWRPSVEAFTPRLELSRPGVCALATRGPSRYFGGDAALASQIHRQVDAVLAERGWAGITRVGVADGPFAAELAAASTDELAAEPVWVVAPGETPAFLAPLPITALAEGLARAGLSGPGGRADADGLIDVLARLGLRTLGDLAGLAAPDVIARFGLEGQLAHRLAQGLDPQLPDTRLPPPHLVVEALLDPPVERVDAAAFTAKALADDLHAQLDRRGLACTRVAVLAETDHGESNQRLWRHEGCAVAGRHRRPGALAARRLAQRVGGSPADQWHHPVGPDPRRGGGRHRTPTGVLGGRDRARRAGGRGPSPASRGCWDPTR